MGQTSTANIEAQPDDALTSGNTDQIRSDAATELFDLLQKANAQAQTWLGAIQAASRQAEEDGDSSMIAFTEPETELAIFLLDEESVGALLRTMNLLVSTAQDQAAQAMGGDNMENSTWPTA
jgi:cell division septum initiation protein DivIVA